jgi:hypothetical protein
MTETFCEGCGDPIDKNDLDTRWASRVQVIHADEGRQELLDTPGLWHARCFGKFRRGFRLVQPPGD